MSSFVRGTYNPAVATRVLLVDDHELVRQGVAAMLHKADGIEIVGEARTGREAIEATRRDLPDVVLMDVRMPGMDGVQATRALVEGGSRAHVIILTTFDLDEYAHAALRAGASGFLLKDAPTADLLSAIRAVASGDAVVAPSTTRRLLATIAGRLPVPEASDAVPELDSLTPREREVLIAVARGLSNAEIADELVLSEATVKTHVGRILAKLALRDRVQIVIYAYDRGLVAPGN
jgi:DNA-binding NarL/FixJ family response regulator